MTIRNMTIILNILKYDNLQYDNYFEKIVIFEFENTTQKKPMLKGHPQIKSSSSRFNVLDESLVEHQKLNQTAP